jgi:hypothetical protein
MLNVKNELDDFLFENDLDFPELWDSSDPTDIHNFLEKHEDLINTEEHKALKAALNEFESRVSALTKDDLKEVYKMLKDRVIHPNGSFDKQGRFYLSDRGIVDVRSPSAKYPYSEMNAGRTAKFVKAMNEKYKPRSLEDFLTRFSNKN